MADMGLIELVIAWVLGLQGNPWNNFTGGTGCSQDGE